jgi:hypothetical protein
MEARMLGKGQTVEQRDSARASLSECIADRDAKARATALAGEAIGRAAAQVEEATRHADAVKIALASARDGREARLREAVEGGAVIEKAVSTREQRFAELDAADEEAAARRVLASCKESAEAAAEAENWAQRKTEAAVLPVLASEIGRLLDEATKLREQLDAKFATLIWLRNTCLAPGGDERLRINSLLPPPPPPGVVVPDYREPTEWIAAREALLVDPDAPLPA